MDRRGFFGSLLGLAAGFFVGTKTVVLPEPSQFPEPFHIYGIEYWLSPRSKEDGMHIIGSCDGEVIRVHNPMRRG
jgi:hypothetical protein